MEELNISRKIIYGLIAMSIMGMFAVIMARLVEKKATETMSGSKAIGFLIYLLIVVVYYIWPIWYWVGLLGEIDA